MKVLHRMRWPALLIVAVAGWAFWLHDRFAQSVPYAASSLANRTAVGGVSATGSPYPASSASALNSANTTGDSIAAARTTMQEQYQQYFQAQQKVLHDNPDLIAEEKKLISEVDAQREKLNAAMVKVDPKTAPIVAKLEAMHQKAVALASTLRPNQLVPPPPPRALTK